MHDRGHNPRPFGGHCGVPLQSQSQPQQQPPTQSQQQFPHLFNPNLNPNLFIQNPYLFLQNPAAILQNPSFLIPQNLNFSIPQNPAFSVPQNPHLIPQNPAFSQNPPHLIPQNPPQSIPQSSTLPYQQRPNNGAKLQKSNETLERVENAVVKAHHDLLATGASVSAWPVSQSALLSLQLDSWDSLGIRMQQVPSLYQLMVIEGKVNAFVHCFVGARRITTLHDLDIALCKNECVQKFEELKLGPLLRHPLVVHYFSVPSDAKEIHKITCEEVISHLVEFMDSRKGKDMMEEMFLEFLAAKESVAVKGTLGVRIKSLRMYISSIQEARKAEEYKLKNHVQALKQKSKKNREVLDEFLKLPPSFSEKKVLDKRFNAISQRIKSFSPIHGEFSGKHVRFVSSSSEVESDDNNVDSEVDSKDDNVTSNNSNISSQIRKISDQGVSGCPYPSASEEMARLGFKTKMIESSPPTTSSLRCDSSKRPFGRKRKSWNRSAKVSPPCKWLKTGKSETNEVGRDLVLQETDKRQSYYTKTQVARCSDDVVNGLTLSNDEMERFITAWKDTCRVQSVSEVFERMLNFYNYNETGRRREKKTIRKVKKIQSLFLSYPCIGLLNIAVTSIKRGMWDNLYDAIQSIGQDVPPGSALATDLERIDVELSSKRDAQSINENASQLECCVSVDDILNKVAPLEVSMLEPQLVMLLSQAASSLWESDEITKHHISVLLKKQFPMISFQVGGSDPSEDISDFLKKHEKGNSSSCVLFSATLLGTSCTRDKFVQTQQHMLENTEVTADIGQRAGLLGSVSAKDAIECLLKAPLLTDLLSWSHWDIIFAPSLGPLMEWLSNEVRTKELLCLLTSDGKMIRIDHSVTVNEFLEASLQGSSFQTALKLLSLFSLYGGVKHFPLSLLKSHARQAIEVILKNSLDSGELEDKGDWVSSGFVSQDLFNNQYPVAAKFILDCLGHLPIEFRSFAADILLSGLRSLTKDAPMLILRECGHVNHRIMLHEIGLALGIMEWIADYHKFSSESSDTANDSTSIEISNAKPSDPGCNMGSMYKPEASESRLCSYNKSIDTVEAVGHSEIHSEVGGEKDLNKVSEKTFSGGCIRVTSEQDLEQDATLVIESIRCEEFGLVPSLTHVESSILKKQHARLGRALHCLSQELYSQDSHLLLELVQNADDNVYPENVEPTLVFILQATGIIILNNEQGFSASNIRALCDVGNSTKKGSSAGYIGQKGIGFKSVFRVTDAPEIHSNGFHVKFDISDGQIGFVLPTVVSPCDIGFYGRLVPCEINQMDTNCWKTCIVLPFKSKLQGAGMSSIVSMFSDLHPSLLLFLHRLRCIKFKNMLNDSCIVMRKETVADGIVKVSHGKEKMSWFVASQKLQASVIRPDVQTTEISIAFTLQESANGEYKPHVDLQPVFAFLPLRTYGLKFILQGDFVLPSSREEVDGDSAWNQWLLSEFPGLFVSAHQSFCALPCFEKSPEKAVVAYMSFVPLVGEVHGFFSHLPRMIISKLRVSNCLLLEGNGKEWVPPCRVLRGWNEQAYALFPETLINQYLGLGYLDKNIILSDALANALGIQEYGPKILVELVSSMCNTDNGIKSMSLDWLTACLSVLYTMLVHSSEFATVNAGVQSDLCKRLRKVPLIPLTDGTYSSVAEGTIWLPSDSFSSGSEGDLGADAFPSLFAKLRTVSSALLSAASVNKNNEEETSVDNCMKMLNRIGVQRLSAHDIIREHILPAISDDRVTNRNKNLMMEYLSFVMLHLQSSCPSCCVEREHIVSELKSKAFILTNHGYKRPAEVSIHFSREFGNPVDVSKLIDAMDSKWHEVDTIYLKQSRSKSLLFGLMKWREFFQELGITDFVQVLQVEKNITDVPHSVLKKMMYDVDIIPPGSILKDWECPELVHLLITLSSQNHLDKCKYLLEVLDGMWDDLFSAKVTGYCISNLSEDSIPLKSSFIMNIHEVQWIVSNMDQKLHYPGDLFYDCDAVRSILGGFVPYAVPQMEVSPTWRSLIRSYVTQKLPVSVNPSAISFSYVVLSNPTFECASKSVLSQASRLISFHFKSQGNINGLDCVGSLYREPAGPSSVARVFKCVSSSLAEATRKEEREYTNPILVKIEAISDKTYGIFLLVNTTNHVVLRETLTDFNGAPQLVKSRRFVSDMAFRTQVTLDDALNILKVWRRSETPFKTSIVQMCKFYSFISDGISRSKEKIAAEFSSGPSIFVPFLNFSGHEGVVHGMFLSQDEVFWHDPTGSVDRTRDLLLQSDSRNNDTSHSISVLAHIYHGLHNFFVNECRVREFPTFRSYIQVLLQLSNIALPSQAANVVLRIFLKWADDLKTGIVGSEDVHYLKEFLLKSENAVLPVVQDKWVSLHPSFGLVCWCDDEELKNQFQHSDNISFLYFGELSNYEKQMLPAKITNLMQSMGVPSLSEVITREAIFYGVGDYREKASLVNWILPFAQRYFYKSHPDKYLHFKQSRLEKLSHLQIVVVEKLFYKYALKGCNTESNKRFECSCLLQENILYMTRDSDFHTVFLELSRLFYNGTPELQLANFLHMITTMIKSGSTEDQTEFFIANSQKVPKLPNDETVWCLSSLASSQDDCVISQPTCSSSMLDEQNMLKSKRKPGINANWRPADWKTAPDFSLSRANNLWTRPTTLLPTESLQQDENPEGIISFTDDHGIAMGIGVDWITQDVSAAAMALALQDSRTVGSQPLLMRSSGPVTGTNSSNLDLLNQAVVTLSIPDHPGTAPLALNARDQLSFGTPNELQAALTGKVGEFLAFKYFLEKFGEEASINWVNQDTETGLPYDIVIETNEGSKEYIEVKSTKSSKKDWFEISSREWQFAIERGDSFSIAHVVLMDSNKAKISVFKNPMRLCQQGMLQLAVLMSRHPKDLSSVT